jgi:hypothetical protein
MNVSGRRPVVIKIAESLSQHVVQTPLSENDESALPPRSENARL